MSGSRVLVRELRACPGAGRRDDYRRLGAEGSTERPPEPNRGRAPGHRLGANPDGSTKNAPVASRPLKTGDLFTLPP